MNLWHAIVPLVEYSACSVVQLWDMPLYHSFQAVPRHSWGLCVPAVVPVCCFGPTILFSRENHLAIAFGLLQVIAHTPWPLFPALGGTHLLSLLFLPLANLNIFFKSVVPFSLTALPTYSWFIFTALQGRLSGLDTWWDAPTKSKTVDQDGSRTQHRFTECRCNHLLSLLRRFSLYLLEHG